MAITSNSCALTPAHYKIAPQLMALPTMLPPKMVQHCTAYDGATFDGAAFDVAAYHGTIYHDTVYMALPMMAPLTWHRL